MAQLQQYDLKDGSERGLIARILGLHPLVRRIQMVLGIRQRLVLTLHLMADSKVPLLQKLVPVGAVIYVISPIDFVPAVLTGFLGGVEDLIVAAALVNVFLNLVPEERLEFHALKLGYLEPEDLRKLRLEAGEAHRS